MKITEYIESRPFTKRLHQLAGDLADEVLSAIQRELESNPERGAVIPSLGGIRKARLANPGRRKGKRGGYRYLYLYLERRKHIHLLLLLDKNEQEDASQEQRRQIRELVELIKRASEE
jgi:mRNA-degrading endonuclease RelE of RelBE toxin-antitoxin system